MQERTLRVLEYTKIRDMLTGHARSGMGKALCAQLAPTHTIAAVRVWQSETEEAVVLLHRIGAHPIAAFDDIRVQLKRAHLGSVLSMRDLLLCAGVMRTSRSAHQQLSGKGEAQDEGDSTPSIHAAAASLCTMRALEEELFAAILGEDEMADNASTKLATIRRKIRAANERVREKLNHMIRSAEHQKHLQDAIITMRAGRYVLPVKQEARQSMPGLIHDQSSSGATLFIEPMAIVEINNDIRTLGGEEQQEIERILAEFSARVAQEAQGLLANLEILAHLDFLFAKAMLSLAMRASQPKMNEVGYLNLKRARHPLIAPDEVVPIDLWLGENFTTLVVTGPNTGGKTVTLKTVGLLSLMAQAGLQVPCNEGSEMAVFDQIFADIGDEQSIEQSLSTFSSHMTNIVHILKNVTPASLALFDELGAGTDPTEGAALAIAILERLLNRRIRTMATTHYSEIKAFALTRDGVENASVEFSLETLRPTYRLSIGIPGKSNAFEISRRLGLMQDIIDKAQRHLSEEAIAFEDVIATAETQRQKAEQEREAAEELRRETQVLQEEAQRLHASIEGQKKTLLRKAKEEATNIVRNAQREMEQTIEQLKKAGEEDQARLIQQSRQKARDTLSTLAEGMALRDEGRLTKPPADLKLGDTVYVQHLGNEGNVLSLPNDKGELRVQMGIMKVNVHISQLRAVDKAPEKKQKSASAHIDMSKRQASLSLDVRGKTLEESMDEVDNYLSDCLLTGLTQVQIVHGKGTGALRTGLQAYMRNHPLVEKFRRGEQGEGDDGVTVVTLSD